MSSDTYREWEEFLDPEVMRRRLAAASMYIASFEFFKDLLVERVRDFFLNEPYGPGEHVDPQYRMDVLSRNTSVVYASLYWLEEMGAISEDDIHAFTRVKNVRNTIAHELFALIVERGIPEELDDRFVEIVELLNKIEIWWVREVYPPFDLEDVNDAEIAPGPVLGLKLLQELALGDDERSRVYLALFRGHVRRSWPPGGGGQA